MDLITSRCNVRMICSYAMKVRNYISYVRRNRINTVYETINPSLFSLSPTSFNDAGDITWIVKKRATCFGLKFRLYLYRILHFVSRCLLFVLLIASARMSRFRESTLREIYVSSRAEADFCGQPNFLRRDDCIVLRSESRIRVKIIFFVTTFYESQFFQFFDGSSISGNIFLHFFFPRIFIVITHNELSCIIGGLS